MTDPEHGNGAALQALLVLDWNKATWLKEHELPFPPFPGLYIRLDAYDLLVVDSVVVGDYASQVTCMCRLEDDRRAYTAEQIRSFGFTEGDYP